MAVLKVMILLALLPLRASKATFSSPLVDTVTLVALVKVEAKVLPNVQLRASI